MRPEIVHRDDARHGRRQGLRNLRIAEVGDMTHAIHIQIVNGGVKRAPHLAGIARKIDHHAAGIDRVNREAVRFQPAGDGLDIGLREAEVLAKVGWRSAICGSWGIWDCAGRR